MYISAAVVVMIAMDGIAREMRSRGMGRRWCRVVGIGMVVTSVRAVVMMIAAIVVIAAMVELDVVETVVIATTVE
jgi:hypothetical protein